jgi:uncharacterized damage-inducible protein DinB
VDREKAFARIAQSRQSLLYSLQGLDEAAMTSPKVEGDWTVKDLLGHIAAWEAICLAPLESYIKCGVFQSEVIPDHDAWNAVQAATRSQKSLADVLEEYHAVRQKLISAAHKFRDEQWQQTLLLPWGEKTTAAGMLSGLAWHEEEHVKSILRWRSR